MEKIKSNRGFTIVEILVAMAILSIISAAIYQIYISQQKTWLSQDLVAEMQQSGRFSIDTMIREMQLMGYDLPAGQASITAATPTTLTFRSRDTSINPPGEQVREVSFRIQGTQLQMAVSEWDGTGFPAAAYQILADNVTAGTLFSYFDDEGNAVSAPNLDEIRRIRISFQISTRTQDPITRELKSMTLATDVRPRNLGMGESTSDTTPPSAPQNVQVIDPGLCGTLQVRWDPNPEIDLSGYYVYFSTVSRDNPAFTGYNRVKVGKSDSTGYQLSGLVTTQSNITDPASRTQYFISLVAYDKSGNTSEYSTEASGDPYPNNVRAFGGANDSVIDIDKPSSVVGFIGADTGEVQQVRLNWTYDTGANPNVVGFRVYRSLSPFTTFPIMPSETIQWVAGATGDGQARTIDRSDTTFVDSDPSMFGCIVNYYAITPVTCDTTLISNDPSDTDTKRHVAADYGITYGDGGGIQSDSPAGSDTSPTDGTPPPAPTISPSAGWKAVFLDIVNPTLATTPDFAQSRVYFSEGGCPTVDTTMGSPTYGEVSNGLVLPNSDSGVRGQFTTPGAVPPVSHLDDDCALLDCSDKPLNGTVRNLENASTYCYLAISYDKCGNVQPMTDAITTLTELCGDDPAGAPGNGSKGGETWPSAASSPAVTGCNASQGLELQWNTMNHQYPGGYYDGAFYKVHMKTGDANFSGISPSSALTLKTQKGAELTTSLRVSSGPIVSGISDGQSYYFGVTATDCVHENDTANYPLNYSDWLTIGPISPGELRRDEKFNVAKDLHREVLTGVTLNDASGTGTGNSTPASNFRHNTVTMFFESTSAGSMTIEKATVEWVNSLAYLRGISIGGGRSGVTSGGRYTDIPASASADVVSGVYNRKITDYPVIGGTISGNRRNVPITFVFGDNAATYNPTPDMRSDQLRITLSVKNESTGTTTCVSYLTVGTPQAIGDVVVSAGPTITTTKQTASHTDAYVDGFAVPGGGETANTVPSNDFNTKMRVSAGTYAYIQADYASGTKDANTGNPLNISSVTLYYRVTDKSVTTAPTSGYSSYTMCSGWCWTSGSAGGYIPVDPNSIAGKRVWYYVVAVDSDGNWDRSPRIEYGAYTFDQMEPDPCDVTPYVDSWQLDTWNSSANAVSNTVNLVWWPSWGYGPPNWISQYSSDTFKYRVYRRNSVGGTFERVMQGSCSGDIQCTTWPCTCTDNDPTLNVNLNMNSYYFKAVNSCDPSNDKNLSGPSNIYTECAGVGGGLTLSVSATSIQTWGSFQVTVNKCNDAADGGYNDVLDNLNITSGSGRDTDIVSVNEDEAGNYHIGVVAYPSTTSCDAWDWYLGPWGWGYICTSNSDTITVSLAGASGSPQTVAVSANPCWDTPNAPTGLNLEIPDTNESNRANSTSIRINFTAPQTNTDGSELIDLSYYTLSVTKSGAPWAVLTIPLTSCTSSLSNPAAGTTCTYDYNAGTKMKDFVWGFSVVAVDSCTWWTNQSTSAGPKSETCTANNNCPRYYP